MSGRGLQEQFRQIGENARNASRQLATLSSEKKAVVLKKIAEKILQQKETILSANFFDCSNFIKNYGVSTLFDRLRLDETRIEEMAKNLIQIAQAPDPVGEIIDSWSRPSGIKIEQIRVPIGVIAIIYESRPNVTLEAAGLCLKSGNAAILRGGSDAIQTNLAIASAMRSACSEMDLPIDCIQLISDTSHESVKKLCQLCDYIDLLIPRGGRQLIEFISSNAKMPVIKHFDGICHIFVDQSANIQMAENIIINSKISRPSACNAVETLLLHEEIAPLLLAQIIPNLRKNNVELRACPRTIQLAGALANQLIPASPEDFGKEFLDLILAIKTVKNLDSAIEHINLYGSKHTDAIVTNDDQNAQIFMQTVDSACVFHNISTRFSDGTEFGFGAEIGISTDKLHARGPVWARDLTTYQYRVNGNGEIRI